MNFQETVLIRIAVSAKGECTGVSSMQLSTGGTNYPQQNAMNGDAAFSPAY